MATLGRLAALRAGNIGASGFQQGLGVGMVAPQIPRSQGVYQALGNALQQMLLNKQFEFQSEMFKTRTKEERRNAAIAAREEIVKKNPNIFKIDVAFRSLVDTSNPFDAAGVLDATKNNIEKAKKSDKPEIKDWLKKNEEFLTDANLADFISYHIANNAASDPDKLRDSSTYMDKIMEVSNKTSGLYGWGTKGKTSSGWKSLVNAALEPFVK